MKAGKLTKETVWAALSKGSTLVFFLLINAALARILGREAFGAWSYFYAAFSVVYLASRLGVSDSARVFTARALGGDIRPPVTAGLLLQVISSSLFALGLLALAGPLCALMDRPDFVLLFRLGALLVFTQSATDFFKLVFEGLHRLRFTFTTGFLDYALRLVLIVTLVWAFPQPWAAVTAFIIPTALCAAVSFLVLDRRFIHPAGGYTLRGFSILSMIVYAAPMFLSNLGAAVSVELDVLMLGRLTSDAEVGLFAPAKEISARMMHGGVLLAMSTLQVFARTKEEDLPSLRPLLNRLLCIAVAFYSVGCVAILLFAGKIMPLIFGAEFAGSGMPMQLLVPFVFYMSVSRVYTGILDYRGQAWIRVGYLALSVLLNVVLNLVLIPNFGAAGAATATSLAYLPYVILCWVQLRRVFAAAETAQKNNMESPRIDASTP